MGSRDHAEECEVCGVEHGGFDGSQCTCKDEPPQQCLACDKPWRSWSAHIRLASDGPEGETLGDLAARMKADGWCDANAGPNTATCWRPRAIAAEQRLAVVEGLLREARAEADISWSYDMDDGRPGLMHRIDTALAKGAP
jgi:hypothetical protein